VKILHVIPNLEPRQGGAAESCPSLCAELSHRDHDVAIYTTFDRGLGGRKVDRIRGVEVQYFPTVRGSYGLSVDFWQALKRKIQSSDVVHVHGLYRFHFVAATYLCRHYKVPYVVKPHGSLDPFLCRVRRWRKWLPERVFLRPGFAHAGAIQFTAAQEMELAALSELFSASDDQPISKGVTVPNGVAVPEGITIANQLNKESSLNVEPQFFKAYPELRDKKLILFLSRINFKKGLDITAKAFALVRKRRDDVHLVIAGPDDDGYSAEVIPWLREGGVLDHATFTGMLTGLAKSAAFQAASVFVLPSYTENFGLAIVEAMSFGVPVVISNRVNIWREILEADAGLVVNCDVDETANAILHCLENPESAATMGKRGRELVLSRFTWDLVADQVLALYEKLVAERSRVPATSIPLVSWTLRNLAAIRPLRSNALTPMRRYGFTARFFVGNAEKMSFPDCSVDLVAVHDGLHHLEEPTCKLRVRPIRLANNLPLGYYPKASVQDLETFRLPKGFRGRPAWFVQLWWLIQSTLFQLSPQFMYGWRRWLHDSSAPKSVVAS
jgi:glycosyltransferase involved in cell wall biosynthesis